MRWFRLLAILALVAALPGPAAPHALEPGFLDLKALGGDAWRVYWKVPAAGTGPMPLSAILPETCAPRRAEGLRPEGGAFVAEWVAACPGGLEGGIIGIEGLELTETDVLVRYELTAGRGESRRLTASETSFAVPAPLGRGGVLATYLPLGVEHILGGIDHLLFVFALILLIPNRRKLIEAVTAFTVAHSISLAAAALGWIVVPPPPVEAVIALSIMFLAAEIVRPEGRGLRLTERYPWMVAFAFGLLHGLGFASALLGIGLPQGEVPLALFAFNLGVEAGQLLFILAVLVVAAVLRRLLPRLMAWAARPGGPGLGATGYLIGSVAAFWFAERLAGF